MEELGKVWKRTQILSTYFVPEPVLSALNLSFYLISKLNWGGYQSHFGVDETDTHGTLINGPIFWVQSLYFSSYNIVVYSDPLKESTGRVRS